MEEGKEGVEELQRQCFGRATTASSSSSSSACRELGDLLARYKWLGEARAAWKRGCRDGGDTGSCWRIARLHYSPSPSHSSALHLHRSVSSDEIKSQNVAEDGDLGSHASKGDPAPVVAPPPLPNDKKAAKYAMRACTDDSSAQGAIPHAPSHTSHRTRMKIEWLTVWTTTGEACVAAGWLTGDREWWKVGALPQHSTRGVC
jgi:hypothetical protein